MRRYRPPKLIAPVTVLQTVFTTQISGPGLGWDRHVSGAVATRPIPGDHETIFKEPNVHVLATVLADELDKLDGHPHA